jgi:hypothetical protein
LLRGGNNPTTRLMRTGLAAAALGSAFIAAPAQATVVTPTPAGATVLVAHNVDFISLEGFPTDPTVVEVVRAGQVIGTHSGTPVDADGAGVDPSLMDINHGTDEGNTCFTGAFTPDILPGDHIVIRQTGASPDGGVTPGAVTTSELVVDDIKTTEGPSLSGGNVIVRGTASYIAADGTRTPIPVGDLDSAEIVERDVADMRGAAQSVTRTAGTTDGWTMSFSPSVVYDDDDPFGGDTAARRNALLQSTGYIMGFGHTEPPGPEMQLHDGLTDEPESGAEGCPEGETNAVTTFDDAAINSTSDTLVVSGTIMPGVTAVTAKIQSGAALPITKAATVNAGARTWTATFDRAQLIDGGLLPNGQVNVSADYTFNGVAIGGRTRTITKDLAAPAAAVPSRAGGTYETGPTSVSLSAGAGDRIEYQVNGGGWTAYNGAIPLGLGTTTLTVRVIDAAGNVTTSTLRYVINRPPAPPVQPAPPAPPAQRIAPPVIVQPSAVRPAAPSSLKVASKRLKLSAARRKGLSASFLAPSGARVVVARLYRTSGATRTLISSKRISVRAGRRYTAKFAGGKLKTGLYLVEVRAGQSSSALGAPGVIRLRVVR